MFGILKEWVLGFWASSPASKLYIASNNVCMLPASYYTKILHLKELLKYKKYISHTFFSPCATALK